MGLLDKQWRYINEGNVHIVLHVVGTEFVVRLIKEDSKPRDMESVRNSINFVNLVMIPLLSSGTNELQDMVELTATELSYLESNLEKFRPEHRRFKSALCLYAIRASNLTILSQKSTTNYCVEIKPKEGFMSPSFSKYSKCYYCLKQFLKLNEGQIEKPSKYCPLDLFSGNRVRMKVALMNLVSNPQNNLKLFKDGHVIYSDKTCSNSFDNIVTNMTVFGGSTGLFLDFLIEILLSNSNKYNIILKESKGVTVSLEKRGCNETNYLENSSFLYKLLRLQKLSVGLNYEVTDNDENIDYVSSILDQLRINNLNLNLEDDKEKFLKATDSKNLALISAVAKDCSIMISFSSDFDDGFSTIQIGDLKIPFKVAVTDLEPKSAKTLAKRKKTEKKLLDIYEQYVKSLKKNTQ